MNKIIKINDKVSIEVKDDKDRTIIILDRNGNRVVLSSMRTYEGFSCDVVFDDNYIVVYSKGSMINQIPLTIECAYNIKTDTILDTKKNKKLATALEMMLISKCSFDIITILLYLKEEVDNSQRIDDIYNFVIYLNNGNEDISRDEIFSYILEKYPILKKYLNIKELDYEKIIEEIGGEYLSFYKMPQIIDKEEDKVQVVKALAIRKRPPYVILEEELQPTDPAKEEEIRGMAKEFKKNNLVKARIKTQG